MKICYFYSNAHLVSHTAQPKIMDRLARHASRRGGEEVWVISNAPAGAPPPPEGLRYRLIRGSGDLRTYLKHLRALLGHLRDIRPDIIHVHGYLLAVFIRSVSAGSRARFFCSATESAEIVGPLFRKLAARVFRRSEGCVVSSAFIQRQLETLGVPSSKIMVARIGLDEDFLKPALPLERETDVLFFGDSTRKRGFDRIHYLAKHLPALRFKILIRWEGSDCRQALGEAERMSQVEVLRFPYAQSLYHHLLGSRLVILPYRWIGVRPPLSLVEAMACRCCVITSALGGNEELIRDGETGIICEFDPPSRAAAAAARLAGDARAALEIGERAGTRIRELYTPAEYEKIINRYQHPDRP